MGRRRTDRIYEPLQSVRVVTQLEIWRLALGLERPNMADLIANCCDEGGGMSAKTIERYENRTIRRIDLFRFALHKYFGTGSVALLGLGWDPETDRWWTWMQDEELEEEMLHRRKMLRGMGVAGLAGTAGMLLPVSDLVAMAQELGGRGLDGRGRIGEGDVRDARKTATRLAVTYRANPDAEAVRAAKAHAYTLLDLLEPKGATMGGDVRRQMQAVASDASALAGYADLNAGRLDAADQWFACALQLARVAGDRRLEALALASRGWRHVADYGVNPDPAQAVAAFKAGAELQRFLPPSAQAWVYGELAIETAAAGDDLASGRFLAHACDAAAHLRYEGPGWGWWSRHAELGRWDGAKPALYAALRDLRIGRAAEALDGFDALEARRRPAAEHFMATRQIHIMEACAALGDLDRACGAAHSALDIASNYDLAGDLLRVRSARANFPAAGRGTRFVRELDERLRLAA